MNLIESVISVLETLVSGVLLTFLFFLGKEKLFPLPPITGRWFLELKTEKSAYNPYKGMILKYVCFLWLEGNKIEGTVEKIYEKSSTGERSFVGNNRTRGVISGYVKKNYLGEDRIYLHVVENGHGRESTNFYALIYKKLEDTMRGNFFSMVADQYGITTWTRKNS